MPDRDNEETPVPDQIQGERLFILLLTFVCGGVTLGVELAASRLLAPSFGTSMLVWSAIIGLMLIYLTVGYTVGGRLADRFPRPGVLYRAVAVAAFFVGIVPFISQPILRASATSMAGFELGILSGSFLAVIALFAIPITLLGMVSPFAIRLLMVGVPSAGTTAGQIYALSTLGSFIGTFVPPLWLIPSFGTRNTFLIMGGALLLLALVGLWRIGARSAGLGLAPLVIVLAAVGFFLGGAPVKATPGLVFETESAYNYIQVVQTNDEMHLKLNEDGATVQSAYRLDGSSPRGPFWQTYLMGALLRPRFRPDRIESVLVIGGAAGTVGKLFTRYYGPIHIDQVEIDGKVVDAGRRFFDMNDENVVTHVDDGRIFLARTDRKYDVIVLDAYRGSYLPFHLATQEFFGLVRDHLAKDGVVIANVLSITDDPRMVDAIGATMATVFPDVYLWAPAGPRTGVGNTQIFATRDASDLSWIEPNVRYLTDRWLRRQAAQRVFGFRPFDASGKGPIFTDDDAPVEDLLHSMIFRMAARSGERGGGG